MSDLVIADKSEIVNIADAVRSLTGSTTTMNLSGMKSHLNTTKTSIDNAFAALSEKGVDISNASSAAVLAELINSIETGSSTTPTITINSAAIQDNNVCISVICQGCENATARGYVCIKTSKCIGIELTTSTTGRTKVNFASSTSLKDGVETNITTRILGTNTTDYLLRIFAIVDGVTYYSTVVYINGAAIAALAV